MKSKGDLTKAANSIGIKTSTLYTWKKLAEYPSKGTLQDQLAFVTNKKRGSTGWTRQANQESQTPDDSEIETNWAVEDKKWAARLKKQKFESERLAIIQAAREVLLSGVVAVLQDLKDGLAKELSGNPDLARRINKMYSEALKKLE